jgi:RNA polymerase sigma-70 factor (ECF subfamily)
MSGQGETAGDVADVARRLYPRLQALAIALTGAPGAAASLARATLAKLEKTGFAARGQTSVLLWAYGELHALWLQQVADNGSRAVRADPRCFALPAGTAEGAARNKGLAQAIAVLPAQQRATLLLVYGEGLSYDEVAEVFGTSLKDVMTRVVRGHVAVAHWLEHRDAGEQQDGNSAADETAGQVA